jgi:high-affinity K+ transport system ATPase subunit B
MALEQARAFEEELKMLFMQTGKIDVWNKIKERQAVMDADDAKEIRRLKEQEKREKEAEEEQMTYLIAGLAIVFLLALVAFGVSEIGDMCAKAKCGR